MKEKKEETDEEIEKQHKEVEEQIKSENLMELYQHRNLIKTLLASLELRCKIAHIRAERLPASYDADQELAYRETLKIVEREIKKKEKQRQEAIDKEKDSQK